MRYNKDMALIKNHNVDSRAELKTYLNVPYAQKDAAKALGARWNAANKKWYVPANMDMTIFAQWHDQSAIPQPSLTTATISKSRPLSNKINNSAKNATLGIITQATDKNFVAYSGDIPPWD